jgi:hypothetical protein
LNDGTNPANGRYDLQFRLYDNVVGGNPIGAVLSRPNTVLINGVFSVALDFGVGPFNNPNSVFMEISVRPNGSPNPFTILGPRQQLTTVPFALRAASAANADNATNAQSAINAQNSVNATNAVSATNAVTAQNALALGGVAPAGWARLNVQNTGDILLTGRLQITGDATQSITSTGLVKAMVVVDFAGNFARCYNGITGTASGTCGFAITQPLAGVVRINFGFPVATRFVSVTGEYTATFDGTNNSGANYRLFDDTTMEVFTFTSGNSADTQRRGFTLIMY